MDFERPPTIERKGMNRERLLSLEKEGKYVFHGSPCDIAVLEPRQGYDLNDDTGKMEEDGQPAVFATPYADIAIFRALTNTDGAEGESMSRFGIDGDELRFSATKNILEAAKTKVAKVYVLDRSNFQDLEGMQCRSFETNRPIEAIEVTSDDLPQGIEIIEK